MRGIDVGGLSISKGATKSAAYESLDIPGRFIKAMRGDECGLGSEYRERVVFLAKDDRARAWDAAKSLRFWGQGMSPADAKAFGQAIVEIAEGMGA